MSKTLPPGWSGNDADQHAVVGSLRVRVYRRVVGKSAHGLGPYDSSRTGPHLWAVTLDGQQLHASATTGHADAAEARRAAILAARVVAFEIVQACDWLDRPPAPLVEAPRE